MENRRIRQQNQIKTFCQYFQVMWLVEVNRQVKVVKSRQKEKVPPNTITFLRGVVDAVDLTASGKHP